MSIFTNVEMRKPKYSKFDLSHERKFSADMGKITPVLLTETVPGDSFEINNAHLVRFAPMLAPMMHTVSVYMHYFYVPNRILWDGWEDFITAGERGDDNTVYPYVRINTDVQTELCDYMGLPDLTGTGARNISALPFAAYQTIYNEYYRDQNLIDPIDFNIVDGDNFASRTALLEIRTRAWQHDYFTSSLPETQKGPEATIPLGDTAPILYDFPGQLGPGFQATVVVDSQSTVTGPGSVDTDAQGRIVNSLGGPYAINNAAALQADLSQATAASIIELRRAFKLQEWLEKNSRAGSRYTESIKSHFGVSTGDARLDRPEFIGGSSTPLSVSEVLQTSSTDATTPQANMAGHGISAGNNRSFRYTCKEHGWILGFMTVMPKTAYQQGIHKMFQKFDKFDYYWPSFAHIGEQAVMNKEVFTDGTSADDEIFGYVPRYAEYKYMNDTVHGQFRTTLDFWHMGRKFANRPLLNQQFIECDPTTRIFANTLGEQLYCHVYHGIKARRPMPYFGSPKM